LKVSSSELKLETLNPKRYKKRRDQNKTKKELIEELEALNKWGK
jgi:hypothetical protein